MLIVVSLSNRKRDHIKLNLELHFFLTRCRYSRPTGAFHKPFIQCSLNSCSLTQKSMEGMTFTLIESLYLLSTAQSARSESMPTLMMRDSGKPTTPEVCLHHYCLNPLASRRERVRRKKLHSQRRGTTS